MKRSIMAAAGLTLAALAVALPAQAQFGKSSLVLYDGANYQGTGFTATGELSALGRETGMNDKASSVRVLGSWDLCEHSNFKGRCVTVTADTPDLKAIGVNNNISSVRPTPGDTGPGFGGGNDGGTGGSNIIVIEYPRYQGVPIFYCGKSILNCGKPNADAFCALVGHSEAQTYKAGPRTRERGYVPMDRSFQSGGMSFSSISCLKSGNGDGFQGGNQPGFGGGGGTGGSNTQVFSDPQRDGYYAAYCGKSTKSCGKPSADGFCLASGFSSAAAFSTRTVQRSPVKNFNENSVSSNGQAFESITCFK